MRTAINSRSTFMFLFVIIMCLLAANVGSVILSRSLENRYTLELLELFWFDGEGNFPTLFSVIQLLIISSLLGVISISAKQREQVWWKHWAVLSGILLFLAVDEAVQIHEKFDNNGLLSFAETQGLLAWPWVIPYGFLVAVVAIGFYRFWVSLPKRHRWRFAICGGLYIFAAIGFEMFGAKVYTQHGHSTPLYIALVTIEETLEMIASALSIAVLISYMSDYYPDFRVDFQKKRQTVVAPFRNHPDNRHNKKMLSHVNPVNRQ